MKNLSSYDKQILFNLKVFKILLGIEVVLNLLLPIYSPLILGYRSPYSFLCIISISVGVLGAHGHIKPLIPLLPILGSRTLQFFTHFTESSTYKVNLISFIIILCVEIGICIYLMIDRSTYSYEEEEE